MPVYDYGCAQCGPFTELRPMVEFADPQPCPGCGEASPRMILTAPGLAMMDGGRRRASATNERSANAPQRSSASGRHAPGCGCCSTAKPAAPAAAKSFPAARPWMISH